MRPAVRFASVAFLGLFAGCGGEGGGGEGDPTLTLLASEAASLQTAGSGSVDGSPGLKVGQFVTIGMVAALRFDLAPTFGSTSTIVSATLRLRQVSVSGTPYAKHGDVVVDLVDYEAGIGVGSHTAPVLTAAVGTLSYDAGLGIKEVDVTSAVASAAAADEPVVDFLLRFDALVLGPPVDYASFEDGAGGLGTPDVPELIVTYR